MAHLDTISQGMLNELSATRYMSAVGLIVLTYDHVLTLRDEIEYIWPAPATYAKYIFLLNRYTVLATLLAVAYEMCGFVPTAFTDVVHACKQFIFTCSMVAIISVGIANLLTLQRVVILWEHRPIVLKIMSVGFLISFTAQVTTMIFALIDFLPSITWSDVAGMCIVTRASPILIAVWACPMIFEVFVLGSTALNALDRPRTIELPIIKALHSDGIGFFVSATAFRILNLILAALSRPSLTFLGVFFIWAMTTTILSRLLLHLRRTECAPPPQLDPSHPEYDPDLAEELDAERQEWVSGHRRRRSRAISPFGLVPAHPLQPLKRTFSASTIQSMGDSETVEVDADVEIESRFGGRRGGGGGGGGSTESPGLVYHYRKRTHDSDVRSWH